MATTEGPIGTAMGTRSSEREEMTQRPDLGRWAVAFAVGGAATIGVVILVFLVALALQPPAWVQVVVGVVLAVGAAIFTWLVASAWKPADRSDSQGSGSPSEKG